ncbi:MAG: outer-membrane lipoprotein carrier protein LolA [Rhizobiaceae bacterium]
MKINDRTVSQMIRNNLLGAIVLTMVLAFPSAGYAVANDKQVAIDAISNHFTSVPTMTGEFIQFGPNGEQTGGTFYIHRPGRIRFNYEDPSPIMVVSNGKTLAVNNKKLKTWSYFPLKKTPLSLLLSNSIKIDDKSIKTIDAREDITTVVMGDKNIFGDSEITLLFDPQTQDLRQWTIKDAQGKETSVMIFNVEKNIKIPQKLFKISNKRKQKNNPDR